MRGSQLVTLILVGAVVGACTLTHASALDDKENGVCPSGTKACVKVGTINEKQCVPVSDPSTGCSVIGNCAPCAFAHAPARCGANGQCELGGCESGYANCRRDGRGCEADLLHDPLNCGECGRACPSSHGTAGCPSATCTLKCFPKFADCNNPSPGVPDADGCEAAVDTDDRCGDCTTKCTGGQHCDATTDPPKCI